jgi:hypothetical protein
MAGSATDMPCLPVAEASLMPHDADPARGDPLSEHRWLDVPVLETQIFENTTLDFAAPSLDPDVADNTEYVDPSLITFGGANIV